MGLRRELMRIITYYYRISKNLKGFISHFHHNFPIYPNYHYINVILNFPLFHNFDLIVTFSGRVGGAPVWRKMERKKKKQDGGWKRGMGAGFVKLS